MKPRTALLTALIIAPALSCGEAIPPSADAGMEILDASRPHFVGSPVCEYSASFYSKTLGGWNYGRTLDPEGNMFRLDVRSHDPNATPPTIAGEYNVNHSCLDSRLRPLPFSASLDGNRLIDIQWNDPSIIASEAVFETDTQNPQMLTGEVTGLLELADCRGNTDIVFSTWCGNEWDEDIKPGSLEW